MTTILAIETPNRVTIACDSMASGNDVIQLEQPKIFENHGVTYGVAGTVRLLNELRYADLPSPEQDDDLDEWMTRRLTPALRQLITDMGEEKNDGGEYNLHILATTGGRVYEITGDLAWIRNTSGVYAAGSGGPFALGAISAGATIEQALEIAAKHDPYTGYSLTALEVWKDQE